VAKVIGASFAMPIEPKCPFRGQLYREGLQKLCNLNPWFSEQAADLSA
jgi:hypothetical protein